ncbi:hypothetical protein BOX15_Mlig027187g1, partial [Macrostomum lignano]
DSTTCDSGLEQSPAADAELLTTSPRSSASPRLAEDDSFNQAASEFERQSVLLPSADLHLQFAGGSSTVARQQQPGADRPLRLSLRLELRLSTGARRNSTCPLLKTATATLRRWKRPPRPVRETARLSRNGLRCQAAARNRRQKKQGSALSV